MSMLIEGSYVAATLSGSLGALSVTAVGFRRTRSLALLACGGVLSGLALATLGFVCWTWCAVGFDPLQALILPPVGLVLLLVMAAQNWFVFYADREDAAQSTRPALILLTAAIGSALAARVTSVDSAFIPVVWAGAGSLAILSSIDPIQRSITLNRGYTLGALVGICKLLLPVTGVLIFVPIGVAGSPDAGPPGGELGAGRRPAFLLNLLALFWELGLLMRVTLINGPRFVPQGSQPDSPLTADPARSKRDSVVLILVIALHVLCGVLIVKA